MQPLAGEFGKGDLNPEFSLGTPLTSDKPGTFLSLRFGCCSRFKLMSISHC